MLNMPSLVIDLVSLPLDVSGAEHLSSSLKIIRIEAAFPFGEIAFKKGVENCA
jgi:hypothetical protein